MTILYLHGLNSSLSPEKRSILEYYGNIEAPALDYENNPDSIVWLYNHFKDAEIDVVIGSSMGGFAAYHISKLFKLPALLFNPALAYRSVIQNTPGTPETNGSRIDIVLGSKDTIVEPKSTLIFLGDLLMETQDYNIHIRHDLEHQIPVAVFDEEIANFMNSLEKPLK